MSRCSYCLATIEYDPNRSANIALIKYADGEKRYILHPHGLQVGDTVIASDEADIKPGNAMRLSAVPLGTWVHNIEMQIGHGGQMCRSAGTYAQLMAKDGGYALLRLPSGELRQVHLECKATIGQVGNLQHENLTIERPVVVGGLPPSVRGGNEPIDHLMVVEKAVPQVVAIRDAWGKPTKGQDPPEEAFQQVHRQAARPVP